MKERLKTILWFIKKPQYIAQIKQVKKRKRNEQNENTFQESTEWCKDNVISKEEALLKLGIDIDFQELTEIFPTEIKYAKEKMNDCPVKMGGEGAISFLYQITKAIKANKIIETGVAYGWSSLAILLAIKDNKEAKPISNDMPYIKMDNDDYVGCVIPKELKQGWILQRLPDVKGIPKAIKTFNQKIDLCHYDSDKSYTGRMFAYPLLWNALKKDGVFVSDDIQDNIAFIEFCEQVNKDPIVIEHLGKYVGIIIK